MPVDDKDDFMTPLDEMVVSGFRGATRCYLIALVNGSRQVSLPRWLIQEQRLTVEPSEGFTKKRREAHIRDTGQGLTEYVNHLMEDEGPQAVIEYLRHLNIRYHDDSRVLKRRTSIPQKISWMI